MEIVNLTPHAIHLPDVIIPKSENIARCEEITEDVGVIPIEDRHEIYAWIPLVSRSYGEVQGLPEERDDTYYIVSMMVRQALPDRKDLLSPGDLVRDGDGNIAGCLNLIVNY